MPLLPLAPALHYRIGENALLLSHGIMPFIVFPPDYSCMGEESPFRKARHDAPPSRTATGSGGDSPLHLPLGELPPAVSDAIVSYIEKKTGKTWGDPLLIERLSRAIVAQKSRYWKSGQPVISYRKGYDALGYLVYHFPVYYVQSLHLMHELRKTGLLFPTMRVLDAGTGPGTVPLAMARFLLDEGAGIAEIFSIEKSEEFIEAFTFLSDRLVPDTDSVLVHRPLQGDVQSLEPGDIPPDLDLIVFQNILSEIPLADPAEKGAIVRKFATRLTERGSLLLVEPADLVHSQELRRIASSASGQDLFVHAPCRYLWGTPCRGERCWSFVKRPEIRPPPFMQDLARGKEGYRFLNVDIKFSYAILRKVPPERRPGIPLSPRRYVRLSTLGRHVDRRIRVCATVISGDLGDRKNHVYLICDGSPGLPVYAVLPRYHVSEKNRWLLSAEYGEIAEFSQVLARFNRKYQAYNLLVTRDSTVRPHSPGEPDR